MSNLLREISSTNILYECVKFGTYFEGIPFLLLPERMGTMKMTCKMKIKFPFTHAILYFLDTC